MEQVPAETRVSVVEERVHRDSVVDVKVTARPEVALAERETAPVPKVRGESAPKVIV
jgi:hypothetical protein